MLEQFFFVFVLFFFQFDAFCITSIYIFFCKFSWQQASLFFIFLFKHAFVKQQPQCYILYKSPEEFTLENYECCTMEYISMQDLLQKLLENSSLLENVSVIK